MRFRGSKIFEVEQQWKPRRIRRNRKWRGPRKMQPMPTKIIKLLEDDDGLNSRNSPCSVISFTLSLDNRIEDSHDDNGWIRTAHIKNPAVNEKDRRSPLFTGRIMRRNEFLDDIGDLGSRQELSNEYSSETGRNLNSHRPSIRERLEPRQVCLEPPGFNAPQHSELPESGIRRNLESFDIDVQRRMEAPMVIRTKESIGFSIPSDQLAYHQNQLANKPTSHQNPRFIRENHDVYNGDRFSRNRGPRCFRQSLYYPPGYSSPSKEGAVRQQRPQGPWFETSGNSFDNSQAYAEQYNSRDRVDYNVERFSRDAYLPHNQSPYLAQSEYSRQNYLNHVENNMRESRSETSFSRREVSNYCDYRTEAFDMSYHGGRNDGRFDQPYSPFESYGPSFSQRGLYSSGPFLPYPSGSSYPPRDSAMDTWYRSGIEPTTTANWDGPPDRNYHYSYQDRTSDEDFTDSDQLDSEVESSDTAKKEVRQMWKNLAKERAILVSRVGASAAMTREWGDYVKKILLERASDATKFQGNWKPRFLRSGLVHRTGLYQIICRDRQTVMWTLKQEIPPLDNSGFIILKRPYDWDCGPVIISMWLSMEPFSLQEALERLEAGNPGIGVANWRVLSLSIENNWRRLISQVSRETAIYLESNGWTVLFSDNLLPVIRLRNTSTEIFNNQLEGDNL